MGEHEEATYLYALSDSGTEEGNGHDTQSSRAKKDNAATRSSHVDPARHATPARTTSGAAPVVKPLRLPTRENNRKASSSSSRLHDQRPATDRGGRFYYQPPRLDVRAPSNMTRSQSGLSVPASTARRTASQLTVRSSTGTTRSFAHLKVSDMDRFSAVIASARYHTESGRRFSGWTTTAPLAHNPHAEGGGLGTSMESLGGGSSLRRRRGVMTANEQLIFEDMMIQEERRRLAQERAARWSEYVSNRFVALELQKEREALKRKKVQHAAEGKRIAEKREAAEKRNKEAKERREKMEEERIRRILSSRSSVRFRSHTVDPYAILVARKKYGG